MGSEFAPSTGTHLVLRLSGGGSEGTSRSKDAMTIVVSATQPLVFFERQTAERCGLHALNNLLQSPSFQAHELNRCAREIRESVALLHDDVEVSEDEIGGYGFEVLSKALRDFRIELVNTRGEDERAWLEGMEPGAVAGVYEAILVRPAGAAHWLAYRRIQDRWYEMDSLEPAPVPLTDGEMISGFDG